MNNRMNKSEKLHLSFPVSDNSNVDAIDGVLRIDILNRIGKTKI